MSAKSKIVQSRPHLTWNIQGVVKAAECISKGKEKIAIAISFNEIPSTTPRTIESIPEMQKYIAFMMKYYKCALFALSLLFCHILNQS